MGKRGQISVEYMLIVGFATLMAIPMVVLYFNYSSSATDSVTSGQAQQIARMIADTSESMYYLGKPSQTTLKLNFPQNLQSVNFSNKEVVFKLRTKPGITDIVAPSAVNMSGNISITPGMHTLVVKAEDNFVSITSN